MKTIRYIYGIPLLPFVMIMAIRMFVVAGGASGLRDKDGKLKEDVVVYLDYVLPQWLKHTICFVTWSFVILKFV